MRSRIGLLGNLQRRGERIRTARNAIRHDQQILGALLVEARSHPEITVSEAAEAAGIERAVAYRLMAKVGGSDDAQGR